MKEANGDQGERAELCFGMSNLLTRSKGISLSARSAGAQTHSELFHFFPPFV